MIWRRVEQRTAHGAKAGRVTLAGLVLACAGCWHSEPESVDDPSRLTMTLRSSAFAEGEMIPKEFTCDGAGMSPPLEWSGVPQGAKRLALICEDPDAPMGTFTHWVAVDLPFSLKGLKESVPAEPVIPAASMVVNGEAEVKTAGQQGKNDFGKLGYGGPCPPSGTHRYVFRIYALDAAIEPDAGSLTRSDVLKAIKGHILAEGRLIGRYSRSK
jgi:Raf kinase inhibitor-like YbhB/YbcL family protein